MNDEQIQLSDETTIHLDIQEETITMKVSILLKYENRNSYTDSVGAIKDTDLRRTARGHATCYYFGVKDLQYCSKETRYYSKIKTALLFHESLN